MGSSWAAKTASSLNSSSRSMLTRLKRSDWPRLRGVADRKTSTSAQSDSSCPITYPRRPRLRSACASSTITRSSRAWTSVKRLERLGRRAQGLDRDHAGEPDLATLAPSCWRCSSRSCGLHEVQVAVEAARHLALPLERQRGGCDDEDPVEPGPLLELAPDEPCLDRLAQPDLVRDQQPSGRRAEELQHGRELVGPEDRLARREGVDRVSQRVRAAWSR